jgi:uncharacterized protein YggT (Ycf19 family)
MTVERERARPEGAVPPADPAVDRRAAADRRAVDEPVAEDRRAEERRVIVDGPAPARKVDRRAHAVGRATQAVDYVFYLLYGLLGIRFVLTLLGASEQAGFVQFIHGLTNPFYAPFANIVARPAVNGGVLDFPLLIAILAYALLHAAVRGLLRLMVGSRTVA